MKTKITLSLIVLLASGLWVAATIRAAEEDVAAADSSPAAWQHLALQHDASDPLARQINELGRDGWEMVTVLNAT